MIVLPLFLLLKLSKKKIFKSLNLFISYIIYNALSFTFYLNSAIAIKRYNKNSD